MRGTLEERLKGENNLIVAKYYALFGENQHRKKAKITIVIGDESILSLRELRGELLKYMHSFNRRNKYGNHKIAYFANIELGRCNGELVSHSYVKLHTHLHIQFFFDFYEPIEKAINKINKEYGFDPNDNHIISVFPTHENRWYEYVIKDYKNFNMKLELNKKNLGGGKAYHTSSHKEIPEYITLYAYKKISKAMPEEWDNIRKRERYGFIKTNISKGNIILGVELDELPKGYDELNNGIGIYIDIEKCIKQCNTDNIIMGTVKNNEFSEAS